MDGLSPDSADDGALVAACKRGDLAAFECIVKRHQRMLLNVAFRITGGYEDACDIVQDSMVAAWQKIGSFRGDAKLTTWLTAIVVNNSRNCRSRLRHNEKYEAYSLDAPLPGGDGEKRPDPPSPSLSALDELQDEELRQYLNRCIAALTVEFREVLVLRDMQDMAYQEVAGALNLHEGTVKSRLFRARDAVKECLKKALGAL